MTEHAALVLVAGVALASIPASPAAGEPAPGPLPEDLRDATVPMSESFDRTPPPDWYEAIGERPIKDMLGEDGCYAVVRVERGLYEAHVRGHYVCVTFAFRDPELEVVSKSLVLPRYAEDRNAADGVYSLWRGYAGWRTPEYRERFEAARKDARSLVQTAEKRGYLPDQGTSRAIFTERLARLGIGSLPSARSARADLWFPVVSFEKESGGDGQARWKKRFSSGGSYGDWPVWRFSAAARWPFGGRPREMSHEFAVIDPLRISDTRYEKLLDALAEFSGLLRSEIEKERRSYAAWAARHAAQAAAGPSGAEDDSPAAEDPTPGAPASAPSSEGERRPSVALWPILSGLAGVILGAALARLVPRRATPG